MHKGTISFKLNHTRQAKNLEEMRNKETESKNSFLILK